jgi:hypothetical protein
MSHGKKLSAIPLQMKRLLWLAGEEVTGKQPTEDADIGLKDLRFGVDIEGYRVDNLSDRILETSRIVKHDQGVKRVYQGEGEVASNIIGSYIFT